MRGKSDYGDRMRETSNHVDGMSDHGDMMNSDHRDWVRGRSDHGD